MAQLAKGVAQPAFDRFPRGTGRGGDFIHTQATFLGHQEGFALAWRQFLNFVVNDVQCLCLQEFAFRCSGTSIVLVGSQCFQRIMFVVLVAAEGREYRCP